MQLSQLHFAYPNLLWALLAIPAIWCLFYFLKYIKKASLQLDQFIDKHLQPYLLVSSSKLKKASSKSLILWTLAWALFTCALAGPRLNFREMETFGKDQSLVIALDLSESMNATDIKPSRLIRAKQKIADLLKLAKGVKIALIAFAADAHMITPLTDDTETIRYLLASLDTEVVAVQGSKLSAALQMASSVLKADQGQSKAMLIVSDGSFEDASAFLAAKQLKQSGVVIHTLGVGTTAGAALKDSEGNIIKKNGAAIVSKLDKERLMELSKLGHGIYYEMHYGDYEENFILSELAKRADAEVDLSRKTKLWDEQFYLFLLPALPIFLWWFRSGHILALLLALFLPCTLHADPLDYFKNSEQLAKKKFDEQQYDEAKNLFQDPYRKGVACYKAKNFSEAEKLFRENIREEVACSALYNLGNSLVQQEKYSEAAEAYEKVLKSWPDHANARENLELLKKMQQQSPQQNDQNEGQDSSQENQQQNSSQNNEDKNSSENEESNSSSEKKDSSAGNEEKNENDTQNNEQNENDKTPPPSAESDNSKDLEEKKDLPAEKQQNPSDQEKSSEKQGDLQDSQQAKQQTDREADQWLNRIENDPKNFLKNKFFIESKKNGTLQGADPW